MSIDTLRHINFSRHIIHAPASHKGKGGLDKLLGKLESASGKLLSKGGSRTGNPEHAMNLLALLIRDHVSMGGAGEDEVASLVGTLLTPLGDDQGGLSPEIIETCRNIFSKWFNMRATEFAADVTCAKRTIEERDAGGKKEAARVRP